MGTVYGSKVQQGYFLRLKSLKSVLKDQRSFKCSKKSLTKGDTSKEVHHLSTSKVERF